MTYFLYFIAAAAITGVVGLVVLAVGLLIAYFKMVAVQRDME